MSQRRKGYSKQNVWLTAVITLCLMVSELSGQTVFTVLQPTQRHADQAYADGNFKAAAAHYESILKKHPGKEAGLRIARSYYFMGQYASAVGRYEKFIEKYSVLAASDRYFLAESYAALGQYEKAIEQYNVVLKEKPDDILVAKKIWQLRNVQYLYEDSVHYVIQDVTVNTPAQEFGATWYNDHLVFLSNRENVTMVENRDEFTQAPFYRLYTAAPLKDSVGVNNGKYDEPEMLAKDTNAKFQEGIAAFFNHGKNMVFTRSAETPANNGRRTLQLHFAQLKEVWTTLYSFPYNSAEYSVTDPFISEDGKTLYFASDMKGGQGGKDLYRSEFINGTWSKPENLVDLNTPYDEVFPFLHQGNVLYFASTGHGGMGGLDVFKSEIQDTGFTDIVNAGYPINTHYDDFSFVLDSLGSRGFFASNRKGGQDDIYRVDIDMQAYPLTIEGVIRYKEVGWADSVAKELRNAELILIDNRKGIAVFQTFSDSAGNFVLHIPYFSQYKIKVVEENKNESIVSLEVPKHTRKEEKHDIVVVRDVFKSNLEMR